MLIGCGCRGVSRYMWPLATLLANAWLSMEPRHSSLSGDKDPASDAQGASFSGFAVCSMTSALSPRANIDVPAMPRARTLNP